MEIDLSNFNVRRTNPIILGSAGLPDNVERYTVKGEGLLSLEVYKEDEIRVIIMGGSHIFDVNNFHILKVFFQLQIYTCSHLDLHKYLCHLK